MHYFLYAWQHFAWNFSCCSFPFLFLLYFGSIETLIYIWFKIFFFCLHIFSLICVASIWSISEWTDNHGKEELWFQIKNDKYEKKRINLFKLERRLTTLAAKALFSIYFLCLVPNQKKNIGHCKATKTKTTYIYIYYNSFWSNPRKK